MAAGDGTGGCSWLDQPGIEPRHVAPGRRGLHFSSIFLRSGFSAAPPSLINCSMFMHGNLESEQCGQQKPWPLELFLTPLFVFCISLIPHLDDKAKILVPRYARNGVSALISIKLVGNYSGFGKSRSPQTGWALRPWSVGK